MESGCCLYETKSSAACKEEGVPCVVRLTKMSKILDKVKAFYNIHCSKRNVLCQEVLEIALNAYNETLCLGISSPPSNE